MLSLLSKMLNEGEELKFALTKQTGGGLKVVVQPVLDGDPDEVKPEVADMRAALSMPLIASVTDADPDGEFQKLLTGYVEARAPVNDAYTHTLAALKEAGKAGQNTKREVESKSSKSGKKEKAAPEAPTAEASPAAPAEKPDPATAPAGEVPAAPVTSGGAAGETDDIFAIR